MAVFEKDFYRGEIREGFYIEPMMKSAWAAEIEVLEIIHGICERHELRYFADWGTLLGAVRHKGFIPWDDDIDIAMLRDDYNKFLQIAQTELPGDFVISSPYTSNDYSQPFTCILNSEHICYSWDHLLKYHGCPFIVGVDIFPLDALPLNPAEESVICTLFSTLFTASRKVETDLEEVTEALSELEELCCTQFDLSGNLKNQLLRGADKVCQLYELSECDFVTDYAVHAMEEKIYLRKEWYEETVWLPFENIVIPAPKNYDEVLTVLYGDYMTPVKEMQPHEYPFYKKQLNALTSGTHPV